MRLKPCTCGGRLLSISDCARELGVCHKTARIYLRRYNVPIIVLGVIHKRVDRKDFEKMLEAMKARGPEALKAMTDRRRKPATIDRIHAVAAAPSYHAAAGGLA